VQGQGTALSIEVDNSVAVHTYSQIQGNVKRLNKNKYIYILDGVMEELVAQIFPTTWTLKK
jgi:hypothetical protein